MSNEEKKGERNSLFVDDCFIRRTYFSFLVIYFGLFFAFALLLVPTLLFSPFSFSHMGFRRKGKLSVREGRGVVEAKDEMKLGGRMG